MNAFSACLLLLVLGIGSDESTDRSPPVLTRPGDTYSELYGKAAGNQNSCGPSALYVFLRLHGRTVRLSDVEKAIVRQSDGQVSFLAMREAAEKLGFPVRIVEVDAKQIESCPFPIVVYRGHASATRGPDDALGHFIVVLEAREGNARYIDGSSGTIHTKSIGYLSRGEEMVYCLESADSSSTLPFAPEIASIVVLMLAAGLLYTRRSKGSGAAAVVFSLVVGCGTVSASDTPEARSQLDRLIWRQPGFDAINASYILLRTAGYQVEYGAILNDFDTTKSGHSLREVAQYLDRFGLRGTFRQCTLGDLPQLQLPILTLREDPQGRGKSYLLVCAMNDRSVEIVDARYVVSSTMSIDRFRREWSGIVFVRGPTDFDRLRTIFALIVPGVVVLLCGRWWAGRLRPARRSSELQMDESDAS
jgi:predicted double-glycine peptidase